MSAPDDPTSLPRAQKVAAMAASLLGMLLAALDQTVVSTAGPEIQRDLHVAQSLYVWITTSYVVASTVTVPLWGKLSDLFGRKRTLLFGMTLFLVGSALCAAAGSFEQLVAFRVLQGVGSAALFTNAFAVTADLFPPKERSKYQGFFGGVWGLASVLGPWIGGYLTDHASWHWAFLVNLPVGAVAIGVAITRMPALRRPRTRPIVLDLAGAAMLMVAMVPLLLALSLGHGHAPPMRGEDGQPVAAVGWLWASWQILSMFAVAALGLLVFLVVERRARDPILDLGLFRKREFSLGCAAAFTAGLPFLATIIFLPQFMIIVAGASASDAAQVMMPLTLGIVVANVTSGQLVSRLGRYKPVLLASLAIQVAAFALMGFTLTTSSTRLGVSLEMIVLGFGLGPAIPMFTLAIQSSVPLHQIGVATSTAVFSRSVGVTVGAAILSAVLVSVLMAGSMGPHGPTPAAWTNAVRVMFLASAAIAALALVLTIVLPAVSLRPHQVAPPVGE